MSFEFDIKDIKDLSGKLQKLHRSSFPVAVRGTLNDMAFDVKKRHLLPTAKENFDVRGDAFFRKFSSVDKATGFNTNSMTAQAGMRKEPETENFHEQEIGGSIERGAIPNTRARIGGNNKRKLSKKYYLKDAKVVNRNKRNRDGGKKSNFIADAYMAHKKNMFLKASGTLFYVTSFRKLKSGKVKFKLKPLYSIKKGRKVHVNATNFIEESANKSLVNVDRYFKVQANRQFKKYFK